MSYKKSTKYLAELFGTFALVLIGCGATVISGESGNGPEGIGHDFLDQFAFWSIQPAQDQDLCHTG